MTQSGIVADAPEKIAEQTRRLTETPRHHLGTVRLGTARMGTARMIEDASSYRIMVPTYEIDLTRVRVFAGSRSIFIALFESGNPHEIVLEHPICRGSTTVYVGGEFLQITAQKAQRVENAVWTDLIPFNTRASVGCV